MPHSCYQPIADSHLSPVSAHSFSAPFSPRPHFHCSKRLAGSSHTVPLHHSRPAAAPDDTRCAGGRGPLLIFGTVDLICLHAARHLHTVFSLSLPPPQVRSYTLRGGAWVALNTGGLPRGGEGMRLATPPPRPPHAGTPHLHRVLPDSGRHREPCGWALHARSYFSPPPGSSHTIPGHTAALVGDGQCGTAFTSFKRRVGSAWQLLRHGVGSCLPSFPPRGSCHAPLALRFSRLTRGAPSTGSSLSPHAGLN